MKSLLSLICALSLVGCATCREHPTGCAVAGVFVAGFVAASATAIHDSHRAPPGRCGGQPFACEVH